MKSDCQKQKLTEIKPGFTSFIDKYCGLPFFSETIDILQMNITKKCNLNCKHCHVGSDFSIENRMSKEVLEKCLDFARKDQITTLDITGGSPELHPDFEWFLNEVSDLGKKIIVRSNLVVLKDAKYEKFIDLYVEKGIEVCASMPHFDKDKFEKQRGEDTFAPFISILKVLNSKGYGKTGSNLVLDLVHNATGAFIPAGQSIIDAEYRKNLSEKNGIMFNNLFSIVNMPVGRFLTYLVEADNFASYTGDLIHSFNPDSINNLMCRKTLNVSADGTIFNCDFNQMLNIQTNIKGETNICKISVDVELKDIEISFHNHCFGCTAGEGSSCQGATVRQT